MIRNETECDAFKTNIYKKKRQHKKRTTNNNIKSCDVMRPKYETEIQKKN